MIYIYSSLSSKKSNLKLIKHGSLMKPSFLAFYFNSVKILFITIYYYHLSSQYEIKSNKTLILYIKIYVISNDFSLYVFSFLFFLLFHIIFISFILTSLLTTLNPIHLFYPYIFFFLYTFIHPIYLSLYQTSFMFVDKKKTILCQKSFILKYVFNYNLIYSIYILIIRIIISTIIQL